MSMQGFTMGFPVIKVRDKDHNRVHIVGTDSHDSLYVDKETGGLHYHNMHNGEGTGEGGSYEFAETIDGFITAEIEFVSFEQLMEIYAEHLGHLAERERNFREVIYPALMAYEEELEKNQDEGIWHS